MLRDRLRALRDRLAGAPPASPPPAPPAQLSRTLPRLERGDIVAPEALAEALRKPGRALLIHVWASDAPGFAGDVPWLLDLHLSWGQYFDLTGVNLDRVQGASLEAAAEALDEAHRSFGLTWRSLLPDGPPAMIDGALPVPRAPLPQTLLRDANGVVLFHQRGPLDEAAARVLEQRIQQLSGDPDLSRLGFGR